VLYRVIVTAFFNHEARAFIASYDEIGLEKKQAWHLPEKGTPEFNLIRRTIAQAEWLADQRSNKLVEWDPAQIVVIHFAEDFLKWSADPSQPRWGDLFRGRNVVTEVWDYFRRHKEDEGVTDD
jgi:hypothetical protein